MKYAIKSTSKEGVYYLCNGWAKHNTFWVKEHQIHKALFNTKGQAKVSLTKLLKVMPEYLNDIFEIIEIGERKQWTTTKTH